MILDLVPENHPLLTTKLESYDFSKTTVEENLKIANDLIETMNYYNGLGLSANQVGLTHRLFVMRGEEPIICFNPKIITISNETILLEESCLSYPKLIVKVKRTRHIRVRYQDAQGEVFTRKFTNMTARIFLHEYDHLEGVIFYNKANLYYREQAFRNRNKNKPVKVKKDILGEYREHLS